MFRHLWGLVSMFYWNKHGHSVLMTPSGASEILLCGFSWSSVPTSINCDPRSISSSIFTIWILRHVPVSAHCYSTSCYTTPTSPWLGRLVVKKKKKKKSSDTTVVWIFRVCFSQFWCWKWRGYYQESPELGWPLTTRTARRSCRNIRLFGLNFYPEHCLQCLLCSELFWHPAIQRSPARLLLWLQPHFVVGQIRRTGTLKAWISACN